MQVPKFGIERTPAPTPTINEQRITNNGKVASLPGRQSFQEISKFFSIVISGAGFL